jgi:DNA-binding CsgD family transcriptional regulator
LMLHNYPADWVSEYSAKKLFEIDPVLLLAERSIVPFSWDQSTMKGSLSGPQRAMMRAAATFGISHGYTVPIHLPWAPGVPRASCTVIPDSPLVSPGSHLAVQTMAMWLYDFASRAIGTNPANQPQRILTSRERQCLELVAQGKDDWTIGQLLRLSEHTVHNYLERAKRRLGVSTRIQAVLFALQGRQISFGDVVRSEISASGPLAGSVPRRSR